MTVHVPLPRFRRHLLFLVSLELPLLFRLSLSLSLLRRLSPFAITFTHFLGILTRSIFNFAVYRRCATLACAPSGSCTNTIPNTYTKQFGPMRNAHRPPMWLIQPNTLTFFLRRSIPARLQVSLLFFYIHAYFNDFESQNLIRCACVWLDVFFMQIYAVYSRFHLHRSHQFHCLCACVYAIARRWISAREYKCVDNGVIVLGRELNWQTVARESTWGKGRAQAEKTKRQQQQ